MVVVLVVHIIMMMVVDMTTHMFLTNVIYLQANQYLELHCAETAVQHTSYIQVNNEQSAMVCSFSDK